MIVWVLTALVLVISYLAFRKPRNLPPGRWGLPVIGYIPLYTSDKSKMIRDFRNQFGNIFLWKLGSRITVGLCDYHLIKATFSRPECQGRPDFISVYEHNFQEKNTGLIMSVGDVWKDGRRFALRHLRDFGMGKSSMEGIILHEAMSLAKSYDDTVGKPVEFSWNLNVAVLNVIWKLVADKRYDPKDEKIMKFSEMLSADLDAIQGPILILDMFPALLHILPESLLNKWMKLSQIREHVAEFKSFFEDTIHEHEKTFDPDNPRDYIDAYLKEMQMETGNKSTIFQENRMNLISSVTSLFRAGSETTSSTMRWMVALMAVNPEIQRKMQKEIDEVFPGDEVPSLERRDKMPYTEAVLLEVHRFVTLLPIGLLHTATEDITVAGYRIPKNTVMFAHSESCHRDPKYWKKPNDFFPEHFLDEDGKLLTIREGFLPFSLGRRQCLGESLAKMELFLFATCLFKRFFFSAPEGSPILTESDPTKPILRFIRPYKVVMERRE
ncbi:cytochrome P450 2L1-like [Macrobrachium rosenbergii]|uniref:cytochrome P450 2L1-like n=1 Tax=Macrobrachium rosenbergii TaxID=79674 RepID=UPI0034D4609C